MTLHHNLIAGEWVGSNGVENINPSNTNEVVGLYATASADDAKTAIAAAKAAFPAGPCRPDGPLLGLRVPGELPL